MAIVRPFCKTATAWLALLAAAVLLPATGIAYAQESGAGPPRKIIRDAEIENIIRIYATPIFQAAGLNPKNINVYLIDDPSLNAFVTDAQHMFIHTGLLMEIKDPREVIGVIAHETGHIAAGHPMARRNEIATANQTSLFTTLLGIGAAIATGRGEVAQAVISGGQDVALRNLLSYTRGQEQAADQGAVRFLKASQQSPEGLLDFMRVLGNQDALYSSNQDPYLRTHPLTRERVTFLEKAVQESPYAGKQASPELQEMQKRMRAKLIGFLEPLPQVLREYPESDMSLEARYARAIAYYRKSNLDKALPLIEGLIAEHPDDPYFQELEGQILFEHGRLADALPHLEKAVELQPDAAQIRLLLARIQLELNDPQYNSRAIQNLKEVVAHEPDNSFAWTLVATGYGREGDTGMTSLAMAEAALASGRYPDALNQADRARKILPSNSPAWLRADDIFSLAKRKAAKSK